MNDQDRKRMETKWFWMMNYCKEHSLPPAQSWAWKRAEQAYKIYCKTKR